ncbi:MAG TPA: YdcF family protein [Anaerolineales bacterium]|nr:YdcF family protein [Anaerolineales bacterium]
MLAVALALLYLASNHWVALGLARSLEWQYLPTATLPNAEVIVVLGGGTQAANKPREIVEVNQAGDRVIYAAFLYKQGKAEHLLLTGGKIDWLSTDAGPAEDMFSLLELLGVPAEAMWLETDSRNTYENAVNSHLLLESKHIHRILLVTSASHMPRSVRLFEGQGFEVIPAPTDFTVTQKDWEQAISAPLQTQVLNLLPSAENLSITSRMLKEYLGLFIYQLRGWI